jgi:hypothetical protein
MGIDTESMRMEARFAGKGNPRYPTMLLSAADEIDALRAEVERLDFLADALTTRLAMARGELPNDWSRAGRLELETCIEAARAKEPPCKP